jgi:heme/copper-type cytochrome/quinol oxidase subunit 2
VREVVVVVVVVVVAVVVVVVVFNMRGRPDTPPEQPLWCGAFS